MFTPTIYQIWLTRHLPVINDVSLMMRRNIIHLAIKRFYEEVKAHLRQVITMKSPDHRSLSIDTSSTPICPIIIEELIRYQYPDYIYRCFYEIGKSFYIYQIRITVKHELEGLFIMFR